MAQAPAAQETCVTYDGAYAKAPLMQVAAPADTRLYFQDKAQTCPEHGACGWRRKGYLHSGDVVFASQPRAGFRCVYYAGASGKLTAGFVPASALTPAPEAPGADLAGRWKNDDGSWIAIAKSASGLSATGAATDGQNSGQFKGAVKGARDGFTVSDGDCRINARARGPYLVVSDNNACGGANVSFGGIYARAR